MIIVTIVNWIIEQFANLINVILAILPDTPFQWSWLNDLTENGLWKVVNYFIPFNVIIYIAIAYVTAVGTWYLLRWVLRFTRYIQ